jgi:hypothetical protein
VGQAGFSPDKSIPALEAYRKTQIDEIYAGPYRNIVGIPSLVSSILLLKSHNLEQQ